MVTKKFCVIGFVAVVQVGVATTSDRTATTPYSAFILSSVIESVHVKIKKETSETLAHDSLAPLGAPITSYPSSSVPFSFRVMTLNIGNAPNELKKFPHLVDALSWNARKKRICKQVLDESPDLIGFQEIRNENEHSPILADLWAELGKHGYEFLTFRNCPDDLAFINTIAYKTKKLAVDTTTRWWASETPDRFSDSWGNGWGRVVLMATVRPIITKMVKNNKIPHPDYTALPIKFVNVHNGLNHQERMNSNRVHVQQIEKLVGDEECIVVVVGDFNSFPDDGGAQELKIFADAGYTAVLNNLKTSDGVSVSGTFLGYSFDKFKSPKDRFGSQVDHVFVKVFSKKHDFQSECHVNAKKYNGQPESKAATETELLVDPQGKDLRDEFCSDHLPGIVDIDITSKS